MTQSQHVTGSRSAARPRYGWQTWGGAGPVLHFTHANGFPPGAYRQMLEQLTRRFRVVSSEARPLWSGEPASSLRSWQPFADDIKRVITEHELHGTLGVGHSLGGAATMMAASRNPSLFSAIVLIDPFTVTGWQSSGWRLLQLLGLMRRLELIRRARRRRMVWPDRDTIRTAWSSKPLFRTWAPGALDDYLDAVLVDHPDGVAFRYSGEWEARIFESSPHNPWPAIHRLEVPTLYIRGADSDTLTKASARRLKRIGPPVELVEMPGSGHLIPMERPVEVAEIVTTFLERHSAGVPVRSGPTASPEPRAPERDTHTEPARPTRSG